MKTREQSKALSERRNRKAIHVRGCLRTHKNDRLRLSVFRSGKHIYCQLINDLEGRTLVSASSLDKELAGKLEGFKKSEVAAKVGALLAERAKKSGIREVRFDRGRFKFHGRIKALAESAKEAGLSF